MLYSLVASMCLIGLTGGALPRAAQPQKPITWPAVNSVLGGTYTVDAVEHTIQYSLESVALASRFAGDHKNVVAAPGKRLLILTSSLTNIQTADYPVSHDGVVFNVFSPTAERSLSTENSFELPGLGDFVVTLKPKGKVRYVTVVQIHGAGEVKRLAVRRPYGRVAWYDIQKDLAAIPSVFANGFDLGVRAETRVGTPFDLDAFDMVVESAGPVAAAGTYQSSPSTQYYAVTLKVTNALHAPEKFGWQYATPTLVDTTGRELAWSRDLIDSASGKSVDPELTPGKPYLVQYVFSAERGRTLREFTLALNAGRTIVVSLVR